LPWDTVPNAGIFRLDQPRPELAGSTR
jgi:hypothetical protein